MKKLLFILFIFYPAVSLAQPTIEWIARYSPPPVSVGRNYIAIDKLGDTYILGAYSRPGNGSDLVTIKYLPNGDTSWVRFYNYQGNSNEVCEGIAADSTGNVYVTGYSGPSLGPSDIVTLKYNPQGVEQWVRVYSGLSNISDVPGDIKLDRLGNVYVAGNSGNTTLLIKYNSNGDSIWVRRYTQNGYSSGAVSVAVDNQYNVYVGGATHNTSTNENSYLTLKYNSNGNLQWHAEYLHYGFELPAKIAIDNSGNCYISGTSYDPTSGDDYLTVKYNSSGSQQWTRRYNGPANSIDHVYDLATDLNSSIYVTGASAGVGSDFDYATIKYNTNGDSLWVKRYNGPGNYNDEAYSLALDDSGNAYVTGRSIGTVSNWDCATIKYYSNGNTAWIERYTGISGSGGIGYGVTVDGNRNVFVTGISDTASQVSYITIKYSQLVGLTPITSETPQEFKLEQNYPNPFNPKSNIKFQIAKLGNVKLAMFDLLGREITTLVNQELTPGTYDVDFDGSNYPSGVYFYSLSVNGKLIDSKKMVLVK